MNRRRVSPGRQLRSAAKSLHLAATLSRAGGSYLIHCAFKPRSAISAARAFWLQRNARRVLRALDVEVSSDGAPPQTGLLVSNHLSYVDILVISSLSPGRFVSKQEVGTWPVFGWFARIAGTIFVNRERRAHTGEVADSIGDALKAGELVVLFPEGTSTGGDRLLPFKSALLEPAAGRGAPVTVAGIAYALEEGDPAEDVCYWREMTMGPHLWNLLGCRNIRAHVRFEAFPAAPQDRKELARQLHSAVSALVLAKRSGPGPKAPVEVPTSV